MQNGDILVPSNPGSPGKWPLTWGVWICSFNWHRC